MTARAAWLAALLGACAAAPAWRDDLSGALLDARAAGRDLVVFFALPGRDASDRMQAQLGEPVVTAALRDGHFLAVTCDGQRRARIYGEWIAGGEGMGIAVLDGDGRCYAARPGPQDPPELAAFLRQCAAARGGLAALRAKVAEPGSTPVDQHRFGCLLLDLGCRKQAEPLLLDAAMAGVADARHRLARLYTLDGNVTAARRWLRDAPKTPVAQVTEGYVLFKEQRRRRPSPCSTRRSRRVTWVPTGSARCCISARHLHEAKQDERAVPLLEALAAEGTGSTFEAAATHTLGHIHDPQSGHVH